MIDATPNLRAHHLRTAILHNSETKIERSRLAELERKERAHDAYVRATRKMADADALAATFEQKDYILGWRDCLRKFSELVVREDT